MKIQQTYRMLKYQEALYKKELDIKKKELQEISMEKQNITIKKIHGELYYYAQQRKDGKVKSRYLSPVIPGKIADIENIQLRSEHLSNEIQDLEWDIMTASKMLACYEKRAKKENFMDEFTSEVYWKDEITARVYVKKKNVIVSRFSDNPGRQLFAEKKMTRYQLGKILELRCFEKGRPDIDEILKHLGLKEYNPYEIVRKTHGVSHNDFIWFRFPGENITSKDVLVR